MMSAKYYVPSLDVICDIGGQDIKLLFLQQGDTKNFKQQSASARRSASVCCAH